MSQALSTADVLRLLEGGNDSPLAKVSLAAAIELALAVPGSIKNYEGPEWHGSMRDFKGVTIPPEVVTRELWPACDCMDCGFPDRPAIVISTQE